MIYINIVIIALIILSNFVIARKSITDGIAILRLPFAIYIIDKMVDIKSMENVITNINYALQRIYVCRDKNAITKEYLYQILSVILYIVVIVNIFCMFNVKSNKSNIIDGNYIKKPSYGSNNEEVELYINTAEDKELTTLIVESDKLNKDEVNDLFIKVDEYLKKEVLGDNKAFDNISKPIRLVDIYPGDKNISINWITDNLGIIEYDGSINQENIIEEGCNVQLSAIVEYYDESRQFNYNFKIHKSDIKRNLSEYLNEEISKKTNTDKEYIKLPEKINGIKVEYEEYHSNTSNWFACMLIGLLIIVLYVCKKINDVKTEINKKNDEMIIDYSELIYKFILLFSAGLNLKKAWEKICYDYLEHKRDMITFEKGKNIYKRYIYEEMIYTRIELDSGVMEDVAYANFGKRIGLTPYLKLSTLLSQSVQRGNENLCERLEIEAVDVADNRNEQIKQIGEKIGKSMVFPMVGLLAITLLLVVMPIFSGL